MIVLSDIICTTFSQSVILLLLFFSIYNIFYVTYVLIIFRTIEIIILPCKLRTNFFF